MPAGFKALLMRWGMPLALVALLYAVLQGISAYILSGATLQPEAYATDLAFHLVFAAIVLGLARNLWTYFALMGLLMTLLHLGNAAKIAILGSPLQPDDALAASALFLILEGGWLALAVTATALLVISIILAVTFRPRRARVAWTAVFLIAAPMTALPEDLMSAMDDTFGNSVWDQRGNYLYRGPLVYSLQETARYASRNERAPSRAEVLAALEALSPLLKPAAFEVTDTPVKTKDIKPRNVHVIVLESFWDPSVLKAVKFSRDPLDKDFRKLWNASANSRALVPVFGGYTANSEFESLCGFPVTRDAVFFEGWLRNDVPCMPRVLSEAGYVTTAAHPNVAAFWNRKNAYDRIGFNIYWSDKDFQLDDMNGDFLGDASLYRQVLDKVQPLIESGTPTFNYVLTFFGHLDYPLNETRPQVVKVKNGSAWLERYANTVYYKSHELMAYLKDLRARDPNAVIVMFGDHLPFLGPNHESYVESGVLAQGRDEFTDKMFRNLVATPLIVIDGKKGPMKLGDMPLYQVPSLVLQLAGQATPPLMKLAQQPKKFSIRPLPGMHFITGGKPNLSLCQGGDTDPDACARSQLWLDMIAIIRADAFAGEQHILKEFH